MKVNAYKNIDIECEVDVELEHCISEMLGIAEEDGMPSRKLQAIDGATKILEKVTPEMVVGKKPLHANAISILRQRLKVWIAWLDEQERSDDFK